MHSPPLPYKPPSSPLWSRQSILAPALIGLWILATTAVIHTKTEAMAMNILVLVSDDQRHDSLGAAGNTVIHTPHLDQLANEGAHFTNAYVTTSICMTSRASILTGQSMSRHGIDSFNKTLTPEQFALTYHGILKQSGYWTGFVGKYGVGAPRPDDFDFLRAYEGRHWMEVDGKPIHVTQRNAQDSIAFLKNRPVDRPFLLSVSFFAPHAEDKHKDQYLPQEWSAQFYNDTTIPESPLMNEAYFNALPEFLQSNANEGRVRFHWRFNTPEQYQKYMTNYFRLITEVDEAVGQVINELKHQGIYENTLIIFIGDNGYFHAERGLADKWYPYEESIRVPLLIHDPRLPTNQRGINIDAMVLNIDLAATIINAADLPIPNTIQGKNLAPLYLADNPPEWREEFFYEHPTITSRERIPSSLAVVRHDMKYILWPEWDHEQLFNLHTDPNEKHNLTNHPDYTDTLETMRQKLISWRENSK